MNKEIKDYLPLYLGCKVQFDNDKYLGNPENLTIEVLHNIDYGNLYNNVKLILRPLSDIRDEESILLHDLDNKATVTPYDYYENIATVTLFLLSKHFDLFNLIESGLAIDKTKLDKATNQNELDKFGLNY